jgi:hypothetical protein
LAEWTIWVTSNVVTDKQRDIIDEKLAESRRLGEEAGKAGDKVVDALRRAAYSRARPATPYRAVGTGARG